MCVCERERDVNVSVVFSGEKQSASQWLKCNNNLYENGSDSNTIYNKATGTYSFAPTLNSHGMVWESRRPMLNRYGMGE